MNLAGKWKYRENYGYGFAEGEMVLEQEGENLTGRIVFVERSEEEKDFMIQEFLTGEVENRKVKLQATGFDIIQSSEDIDYKLDSWFGIWVDEDTIKGISMDFQGVEGSFIFERIA